MAQYQSEGLPLKVAYLLRVRPDLEDIVPDDVEHVVVQVGDDGRYDEASLAKVADAEAFIIGMEPVNEQILARAPKLRIVQRLGVGYETLDLEATARRGIPACNIEGVNKEAVAEHGMTLILALAKNLLRANAFTQEADWASARMLTTRSFELKGKTLGIIGFGNTGSELARRARAFEMEILYNDVRNIDPALAASVGAQPADKETLLRTADIVSINTDLNDTTRRMIGADQLALMRPHAMLVCCARGGILDEEALAEALRDGRIAAAGVDVFETEPVTRDNPLLGLANCIVTAHVAGVASETTARIWEWAHDNVRAVVVRGEKARWVRNGVA
jgi:phosphoglycerate dehydrogenase-like enzyme